MTVIVTRKQTNKPVQSRRRLVSVITNRRNSKEDKGKVATEEKGGTEGVIVVAKIVIIVK